MPKHKPRTQKDTLMKMNLKMIGLVPQALQPALAAGLLLSSLASSAQEYHANDLTPPGSASGRLNGTSGGRQVGASQASNGYSHAVVLGSNALTAVDLNPANYIYSMAMCSDDFQQGGWAYSSLGGI